MSETTKRFAAEACAAGLTHAFGVPGSGQSLELIDALEGGGCRFVTTQHEGAGAVMAGTLGRLSGRAGLSIGIKGPGFANMAAGLAACRLEAWPVIAAVEAYGPQVPAAKAHKRMAHDGFTTAVAKGARRLSARGPDHDRMAGWAEVEEPGPVVLELVGENDEGQAPVPGRAIVNRKLTDRIRAAERPVVIAGTFAIRQGWSAALNALKIPVFSTAAAKGVVDENAPQAAGVFTGVGLELAPESRILPLADLVVGLGLRPSEVLATKPFACDALNVDDLEAPGQEGFGFLDTVGADGVFEALGEADWGLDLVEEAQRALTARLGEGPFLPADVFAGVRARFGTDVRMVIDTGYFCTIGEHAWQAPAADLCLSSGSGRFMGIGLPQALAAALSDPARPTVLATGDGGLGPYLAEAHLAVRAQLPLTVLLLSDGGYGSVRTRAVKDGLTQSPMLTPDRPWRAVFEGLGFATAEARDADGLAAALATPGPSFVACAFDAEAYQDMVRGIR